VKYEISILKAPGLLFKRNRYPVHCLVSAVSVSAHTISYGLHAEFQTKAAGSLKPTSFRTHCTLKQ